MSQNVKGMASRKSKFIKNSWEEYLSAQSGYLPSMPMVEQVSPRVIRILAGNPGLMTLQGTNTYLVGTGSQRILIDTGEGHREWIETLREILEENALEISHILLTHWHGDHTGGLEDLRRTLPVFDDRVYKNAPDLEQNDIKDGSLFRTSGATLRALHTPGHAFDHMCFILEEENAIFTGDNVLGHGFTVVESLGQYMKSLDRIRSEQCSTGYPGHGEAIKDLPLTMHRYIQHRRARENQIVSALPSRQKPAGQLRGALTVRELVAAMHGHVSSNLSEEVLEPAVTEVLWKLAEDRRVGFQVVKGSRHWFSQC